MLIPKRIFTIWLSDDPKMPELIEKCIATHDVPGYEHVLYTLSTIEDMYISRYFQECITAKQWAKAADYLRIWLLNRDGGIYLDADVEVVRSFDDLLNQPLFCGAEENGFVSNAIIGSVSNHPVLAEYLGKVDRNFIGGGDLIFQPGMFLWTEIIKNRKESDYAIYMPEFFLPYNHHLDRMQITENTYTIHYFSKSWLKEKAHEEK